MMRMSAVAESRMKSKRSGRPALPQSSNASRATCAYRTFQSCTLLVDCTQMRRPRSRRSGQRTSWPFRSVTMSEKYAPATSRRGSRVAYDGVDIGADAESASALTVGAAGSARDFGPRRCRGMKANRLRARLSRIARRAARHLPPDEDRECADDDHEEGISAAHVM